jgi:ATP-dependent RNA helicase SUPV3L1/SUV3
LKPLVELSKAEDITGLARGIAFRLKENFGVLRREDVAEEMKSLDQPARAQLRKYGVRFGAFNIYFPLLLKPASTELALTLWLLHDAAKHGFDPENLPEAPRAGLTSMAADPARPDAYYRTAGFHVCGPRAVRIDMLERLADQIRPLLAWRKSVDNPTAEPPKGSTGDGGFIALPAMMSILGCPADQLGNVLKALGFRSERRPAPVPAAPAVAAPAAASSTAEQAASAADSVASAETEKVEVAEPSEPPLVEAPPEIPSAETVAATAPEAPAAGEATQTTAPTEPGTLAAAEPATIEIWRPRRHRGPERHERGEAGAAGDGKRERSRRWNRNRPGHKPNGPGEPAPAAASADPQAAPAPATTDGAAADPQPRHERAHRDRTDRKDRHDRKDRRPGERHGDRPHGQRRDDRGRGPRDDRARPNVISAAPPAKAGQADSPFAALGALKAALEKGNKE